MLERGEEIQMRLQDELERIDRILKLGLNLKVVWVPSVEKGLSGEVKGRTILIYEGNEGEVLNVLRHEILDYCVSQPIEPYKEITNMLIKMLNKYAYKRKEKIVEALTRLIQTTDD